MPRCSVCGKVFPEGQGILIDVGGRRLVFHKKTCATKFLRELLLSMGPECYNSIDRVLEIFSRSVEERARPKRMPGSSS